MIKNILWFIYATDFVLRKKVGLYRRIVPYCKKKLLDNNVASNELAEDIRSGKPIMAARYGLFEIAAMRMYEFEKKAKYPIVMGNIYNCAGFFPNDITLGYRFLEIMKKASMQVDYLAASKQLCENYFINKYMKDVKVAENFKIFDVCALDRSWTEALKGKKVLVISPFSKSVEKQYEKRELLFPGTDILPKFELQTYQSLMTVGDLKDERFADWFEALDFMKNEILKKNFDVAILGCGAYGFPLAAEIKKAGKQAIHMGGAFQILFGIMGKRWDGTRNGGPKHIREDIAKYYNEYWTYPIEEKPKEASKVEYGPYWE